MAVTPDRTVGAMVPAMLRPLPPISGRPPAFEWVMNMPVSLRTENQMPPGPKFGSMEMPSPPETRPTL
jgi:hypothetical protein